MSLSRVGPVTRNRFSSNASADVSARGPSPSVTFALDHAGETLALAPVMRRLVAEGRPISIVAPEHATARTLIEKDPTLAPYLAPGFEAVVAASHRNPTQAQPLAQQRTQALSNPVLVTGGITTFEALWARYYRQQGRPVFGFYDGLERPRDGNTTPMFRGTVSTWWTPTLETALTFRTLYPDTPALPVGHPGVDQARNARPPQPSILHTLGLSPTKPTVLFVGGYGPGYADALTTFCRAMAGVSANVVISPHPSQSGDLERRVLQTLPSLASARLLPKSIPTPSLLPEVSAVVTQGSSLSTLAAMRGVPVLLVGRPLRPDEEKPEYRFGLATRYQDAQGLNAALKRLTVGPHTGASERASGSVLPYLMGVPWGSVETMVKQLG